MKINFLLLTFCVCFVFVNFANSQTLPIFDQTTDNTNIFDGIFDSNTNLPTGVVEQISTTVVPKIPSPGETVTITVDSFSSDLNKAKITWKADGSIIKEGVGETKISFSAPPSGKTLEINLTIIKEGGGIIQRTFSFSPSEVDLIYEAETYVPPFYKGKALFTSESTIKFVAMPNFVNSSGQKIDPSNLVYNWKINDSLIQESSGYGKRVFETKGQLLQRTQKIGVEVSAINSDLKAKDSMLLDIKQPEVILYENNPLLGVVYEKGLKGSFLLDRPEVEIQSVPYFFSTTKKDNSEINYIWKINGYAAEAGSKASYSRFRNETGEAGRSIISLDVQHFANILQVATTKLDLNFTEHNNVFEKDFEF